MPTIVWTEPEETTQKKPKNVQLFEALVENPGQWGRIGVSKSHKAAYTRMYAMSREAKKLGFTNFEFTARKLKNNQGGIWARYAGNGLPEFAYGDEFVISN